MQRVGDFLGGVAERSEVADRRRLKHARGTATETSTRGSENVLLFSF